jgi:hypothetical protein
MVTAAMALAKYGDPRNKVREGQYMTLWNVPAHLRQGKIPGRVYCNRAIQPILEKAFENLIARNHVNELATWDGCFNVRMQRGSTNQWSLHSWGLAIDLNAATNGLGKRPTLSPGFVKCFTDAGFHWGGTWARPDGMHFQIANL